MNPSLRNYLSSLCAFRSLSRSFLSFPSIALGCPFTVPVSPLSQPSLHFFSSSLSFYPSSYFFPPSFQHLFLFFPFSFSFPSSIFPLFTFSPFPPYFVLLFIYLFPFSPLSFSLLHISPPLSFNYVFPLPPSLVLNVHSSLGIGEKGHAWRLCGDGTYTAGVGSNNIQYTRTPNHAWVVLVNTTVVWP